jgi:hypothetical protein
MSHSSGPVDLSDLRLLMAIPGRLLLKEDDSMKQRLERNAHVADSLEEIE